MKSTALWETYRNKVYNNQELPPIQERQLSMAFYAGMTNALDAIDNIIQGEKTIVYVRTLREEAATQGLLITKFFHPPPSSSIR